MALLKYVGVTGRTQVGFVVRNSCVYVPDILVDELIASGDFEPVDKPVDKSGELVDNSEEEAGQDDKEPVDNSGKEPAEKPKAKKKGGKK